MIAQMLKTLFYNTRMLRDKKGFKEQCNGNIRSHPTT